MSNNRKFFLAFMNIHYGQDIEINAVVEIFARKKLTRLLLADLLPADY